MVMEDFKGIKIELQIKIVVTNKLANINQVYMETMNVKNIMQSQRRRNNNTTLYEIMI